MTPELRRFYPELSLDNAHITSPESRHYNCVSWALSLTDVIWYPDSWYIYYWPPGIPREERAAVFEAAFVTLGYIRCDDSNLEPGFEKLAIYVDQHGRASHVARQLPNGNWTSKLADAQDIEHGNLRCLEGWHLGAARIFLKKPIDGATS